MCAILRSFVIFIERTAEFQRMFTKGYGEFGTSRVVKDVDILPKQIVDEQLQM